MGTEVKCTVAQQRAGASPSDSHCTDTVALVFLQLSVLGHCWSGKHPVIKCGEGIQ